MPYLQLPLFAQLIFWTFCFFCRPSRFLVGAFSLSSVAGDSTTDTAVISCLLQKCDIPLSHVTAIQPVTSQAAFCNALYRVCTRDEQGVEKTYMAKVFSELATSRMKAGMNRSGQSATHDLFRIDRLAAKHGLGPFIHAAVDYDGEFMTPALLMEDCVGQPLTLQDLYQDGKVVHLTATALAKLHALEPTDHPPKNQNNCHKLWQSCHVLMQQYADPNWESSGGKQLWTYDRLYDCMKYHESEARYQRLLTTGSGHGDCKPSNLLLHCSKSRKDCCLRILDFELSGRNYVAFDLAKLWRSSLPVTPRIRHQLETFIETYIAESGREDLTSFELRKQMDLLLPFTWLDSAIFFVAMAAHGKTPDQRMQFHKLAEERLRSYDECRPIFSQIY